MVKGFKLNIVKSSMQYNEMNYMNKQCVPHSCFFYPDFFWNSFYVYRFIHEFGVFSIRIKLKLNSAIVKNTVLKLRRAFYIGKEKESDFDSSFIFFFYLFLITFFI